MNKFKEDAMNMLDESQLETTGFNRFTKALYALAALMYMVSIAAFVCDYL